MFAIAHATALPYGSDRHTNFVQDYLRAHLYRCLDYI